MTRNELGRILAIVGGAIILVGALIVATRIGHHSTKPSASNIQVDSINDMLSGIPQKGIELGSPNAKVTLIEFSDPQCPYCGDWARTRFPSLVQSYVRTGKLRIEYRGLAFVGPDSTRLLRLAQAASLQNKLWNVVELEFENQGTENSGYATDPFMRGIAQAVPGLDANKALATWNTSAVAPMINATQALATARLGNDISTPTFLIGLTGSKQTEKIVGDLPLSTFTKVIAAQLNK